MSKADRKPARAKVKLPEAKDNQHLTHGVIYANVATSLAISSLRRRIDQRRKWRTGSQPTGTLDDAGFYKLIRRLASLNDTDFVGVLQATHYRRMFRGQGRESSEEKPNHPFFGGRAPR